MRNLKANLIRLLILWPLIVNSQTDSLQILPIDSVFLSDSIAFDSSEFELNEIQQAQQRMLEKLEKLEDYLRNESPE